MKFFIVLKFEKGKDLKMRKLTKVWKDNGEREVTTWKKEKCSLSNSYKDPEIVKQLLIQNTIKLINLTGSYLELEDKEDFRNESFLYK